MFYSHSWDRVVLTKLVVRTELSVAILLLFKRSFAKYFFISLYLPLWKFITYFVFVFSDFNLMLKRI